MKKIIALVALMARASLSSNAFAQTVPKAFYMGAGIGGAWSDVTDDISISGASTSDNDTAYKIYGGYDFGRGFGLEMGYYYMGTSSVNFSTPAGNAMNFTGQALALSGTFVGSLGQSNWFWASKLGLAWTKGEYECVGSTSCAVSGNSTKDSVGAIFGMGLGYNISKNFSLRADWEAISNVDYTLSTGEQGSTSNLFTVSAQFRF